MSVRAIGAGAMFVGTVLAGLLGAGQAAAAPGIDVQAGDQNFGFGDRTETGAQAFAKPGNTAIAVSINSPSIADASEGGTANFGGGNNILAIDSTVKTFPTSKGNNILAVGSDTATDGQYNTVVTFNGVVTVSSDKDTVLTSCATTFSGQADKIVVNPGAGCD